jgi:hypothetical protein
MIVSGIKFTKLVEGILCILKMAEIFTSRLSHTIGTCTSPQWRAPSTPPAAPSAGVGREGPGAAALGVTRESHLAKSRPRPRPAYPLRVTRQSGFGSAAAGPRRLHTRTHTGPCYPALGAQAAAALRQTPRSYPTVGLG